MDRAEALRRLAAARVGRFASITPAGEPHIVPVTFALIDDYAVHMIDDKPKTTSRLKRLRNVEANPRASLLVDRYEEDWPTLWWVRVDGEVEVVSDGDRWDNARRALSDKYPQYRESPPIGPAIFLSLGNVTHWEGT